MTTYQEKNARKRVLPWKKPKTKLFDIENDKKQNVYSTDSNLFKWKTIS